VSGTRPAIRSTSSTRTWTSKAELGVDSNQAGRDPLHLARTPARTCRNRPRNNSVRSCCARSWRSAASIGDPPLRQPGLCLLPAAPGSRRAPTAVSAPRRQPGKRQWQRHHALTSSAHRRRQDPDTPASMLEERTWYIERRGSASTRISRWNPVRAPRPAPSLPEVRSRGQSPNYRTIRKDRRFFSARGPVRDTSFSSSSPSMVSPRRLWQPTSARSASARRSTLPPWTGQVGVGRV